MALRSVGAAAAASGPSLPIAVVAYAFRLRRFLYTLISDFVAMGPNPTSRSTALAWDELLLARMA